VFNDPQRVADWAKARMPNFIGWSGYYQGIGYERESVLKGAVIYTNSSPRNVFTSIVLEAPLTRRFLRAIFYYPFKQLNVVRLTAHVEEWNTKSLKFCQHVGFEIEGTMRQAAANGGDVIVMGYLRENCPWL
jgi:L-amino acid N-acyltransferase YncA